jgi:protein AroM
LKKRATIGIATIGQSPRVDVVPELKEMAGVEGEFLECGVLDGSSLPEIEKLAPEKGQYMLVTRLSDGSHVRLARDKIIEKMQKCIDSLVDQGADLVIVLCVGEWPKFRSKKLVVTPSEPLCGFALGLVREGDTLGLIVPADDQIDDFKGKYRKDGVDVVALAASPYGPTAKDESIRAAETLKERDVDLVVMDCPGYTMEVKDAVQGITEKPVITVRSAIAAMIRQLAG